MQTGYVIKLKRFLRYIHTTIRWRLPDISNKSALQDNFSKSLLLPRRKNLESMFRQTPSIEAALEIGCGRRVNLKYLFNLNPCLDLHGSNINGYTLRQAKLLFPNAKYYKAKFEEYDAFQTKFDLVFSVGSLIYALPAKIDTILQQMVNMSNTYVCIIEQSSIEEYSDESNHYYDYQGRLEKIGCTCVNTA